MKHVEMNMSPDDGLKAYLSSTDEAIEIHLNDIIPRSAHIPDVLMRALLRDVDLICYVTGCAIHPGIKLHSYQYDSLKWFVARWYASYFWPEDLDDSTKHLLDVGILADDMGLGKTLQIESVVIAKVAAAKLYQMEALFMPRSEASEAAVEGSSTEVASRVAADGVALSDVVAVRLSQATLDLFPPYSIVFVPNDDIRDQWMRELSLADPHHQWIEMCKLQGSHQLANIESADAGRTKHLFVFANIRILNESKSSAPFQFIMTTTWAHIIFDEAHRLKSDRGKTHMSALEHLSTISGIGSGSVRPHQHMYFLTGTPMQNNLEEFVALLNIIGYETEIGICDLSLAEIRRVISRVMLRRVSEDIGLPIPDIHYVSMESSSSETFLYEWQAAKLEKMNKDDKKRTRGVVNVLESEMIKVAPQIDGPDPSYFTLLKRIIEDRRNGSAELRELHAAMKAAVRDDGEHCDVSGWLERLHAYGRTDMKYAAPILGDFGRRRVLDLVNRGHLQSAIDYVDDMAIGMKKVIIFTNYDLEAQFLVENLGKVSAGMYTGNHKCNLDNFIKGGLDTLILSLTCGSEGLNLQVARTVIMSKCSYNPNTEIQGICRIHRQGQVDDVFAYIFNIDDPMRNEAHKQMIASKKIELITDVIGKSEKIRKHRQYRYGLVKTPAAASEAEAYIEETAEAETETPQKKKQKQKKKQSLSRTNLRRRLRFMDWLPKYSIV